MSAVAQRGDKEDDAADRTHESCNQLPPDDDHPAVFLSSSSRPSNEYVLNVAFLSFLIFTTIQFFFASVAHSDALMTDCAAMMVDVVTYLFNFLAERLKQNDVAADVKNAPGYQPVNGVNVSLPREWRLRRLVLELVPPGISVATLVVVTVAATRKAWIILQEDSYIRQQPNLTMMLVFSILNLFLDVLNVSCFARVDQAVGLPGQGAQSHADNEPASKADRTRTIANRPGDSSEDTTSFITESTPLVQSQNDVSKDNKLRTNSDKRGTDDDTASEEEDDSSLDATGTMNLNMCSAWTHVCADTYRSIAVLMASGVAFLFPTVCTPLQADSGGAIVVSIIILISLVPLIQALYLTACKIRDIWIAESDGAHHHHYYHSHDLAQFYQA